VTDAFGSTDAVLVITHGYSTADIDGLLRTAG
jgi:hypothetical protein